MKVKMLEYYQDRSVVLPPDFVADVSDELGAWLLEHRKAVAIVEDVAPQVEQEQPQEEQEQPQTFEKPQRSRRAK